ncbi:MAG: hypothetical protein MHPSP_001511, partial [Paramarteilia canceri]
MSPNYHTRNFNLDLKDDKILQNHTENFFLNIKDRVSLSSFRGWLPYFCQEFKTKTYSYDSIKEEIQSWDLVKKFSSENFDINNYTVDCQSELKIENDFFGVKSPILVIDHANLINQDMTILKNSMDLMLNFKLRVESYDEKTDYYATYFLIAFDSKKAYPITEDFHVSNGKGKENQADGNRKNVAQCKIPLDKPVGVAVKVERVYQKIDETEIYKSKIKENIRKDNKFSVSDARMPCFFGFEMLTSKEKKDNDLYTILNETKIRRFFHIDQSKVGRSEILKNLWAYFKINNSSEIHLSKTQPNILKKSSTISIETCKDPVFANKSVFSKAIPYMASVNVV